MEHLQRGILLLLTVFLILSLAGVHYQWQERYWQEYLQAETVWFLEGICRSGTCTMQEYLEFCGKVQGTVGNTTVVLEEYRSNFGADGGVYYEYVPWEEIQEELGEKGKYQFQKKNEVCISVGQMRYCGLVWRKK